MRMIVRVGMEQRSATQCACSCGYIAVAVFVPLELIFKRREQGCRYVDVGWPSPWQGVWVAAQNRILDTILGVGIIVVCARFEH